MKHISVSIWEIGRIYEQML